MESESLKKIIGMVDELTGDTIDVSSDVDFASDAKMIMASRHPNHLIIVNANKS